MIAAMSMNAEIEALIANLNNHRKHLPFAIIAMIDRLREMDKQPGESQKNRLYLAERKLRRDLGDEEFYRGT